MKICIRSCFAAAILLFQTYGHAAPLTIQVGNQSEYSNNIALTPDNEDSGWIQRPQALVGISHEGPSLAASANYRFSREIYQGGSFNSQSTTEGTGAITWRAIADRLSFNAANSSTRTTINAQDPSVPTNEQVTNTTTAGSNLTFSGFANQTVNLGYAYSIETAQTTDTDSKTQTISASYIIPVSNNQRVQLNGNVSDVQYDSSANPDYVSQSGNIQYVRTGTEVDIDTSIGYTVFDREQQTDDASGTIGSFSVVWRASGVTGFNAQYARSLQSDSPYVTEGIPEFGQDFSTNSGIVAPYTLSTTTVGVTTQLGHNSINLSGYVADQDYDGVPNDQRTTGASLGLSRALRPTLSALMYLNYAHEDFTDQDQKNKTLGTGLRFDWTRWRNLSVSFGTAYQKRDSNVETSEYTEWMGSISLMYMLVGQRN